MTTNKPTHTPGPWRYSPANTKIESPHGVHGPEGDNIAVCNGVCLGAQNAANARLIAAAPELLAALKEMFGDATDGKFTIPTHSQVNAARAAIAKAEAR